MKSAAIVFFSFQAMTGIDRPGIVIAYDIKERQLVNLYSI